MRQIIFSLLCFSIIAFFSGCNAPLNDMESYREDASPPEGYKPVFISGLAPITEINSKDASLYISRVDVVKPDLVKLYIHLYNAESILLTDALKEPWKKCWCDFTEEVNENIYNISKYSLTEIPDVEIDPIAISLVMDHSGSIGEERANIIQNVAADLVKMKNKKDEIALIKYDSKAVIEQHLTIDESKLLSKLQPSGLIGYGKQASITNAIFKSIEELKNSQLENKFVIIYTDSKDEGGEVNIDSILTEALENNITICGIDFGNAVDYNFLKQLAILTGGTYNHIYSTNEFKYIYKDIYRRLQHAYVLEYQPVEYGLHTVTVNMCFNNYSINTSGTFDNTPEDNIPALLDVQFDFDKAELKETSRRAINTVCELLKKYPFMVIEVRGHTDNAGDKNYNLKLSQQRADNVKAELIKCGTQPERIKATGYGDSMPIADNNTKDGRSKNRRTEFVIIRK